MVKNNLSKIVVTVMLLAMVIVSVGCGKQGKDAVGNKKKEGSTLTIGMPATHVAISNIKHHQKEWEKQTGNKIDVQAVDDNQFDQLALTKITSGGMWDIMFMQTGQESAKYNIEENFIDLSDQTWASRLKDEEKKFLEINNNVYYYPNGGINSFGIVYNKDVFEKNQLEVPTTFEEFNQVAKTLKAADITPIYISMKDPWTVNQILNAEWPNILAANPEALDKLNKNEINWSDLPEFKDLFVRMEQWVKNEWINDDMATASYEMAQKAIGEGKAAMMYMGDWADPEFIKAVPEAEGKLGMFAAPSKDGKSELAIAGPGGYVISKEAKNEELAKDFLNYLSSEEALKYDFETKHNTSVWQDVDNDDISVTLKDSLTYIDEKKTQIHYNKTYYISPSDDANSAFLSILLGQESPEEAVATWNENILRTGKQLGIKGF